LSGGFAGLFRLQKYNNPVLVSGSDGVGTKLKIAFDSNKHHTIGIDLVAMSVNDCLSLGAEPLFFLDYFSTSSLDGEILLKVLDGIVEGCKQSRCALLGGETAQLPGFYHEKDYDLAGFCVAIVEDDKIIDGSSIVENDVVLGLASSGLHSNGFSLVRKILFDDGEFSLDSKLPELEKPLEDELLVPTKIYVRPILAAIERFGQKAIKGLANITGGGTTENLPRILPKELSAVIDLSLNQRPAIFDILKNNGNISEEEMRCVFNCGIGFIIVVDKSNADEIKTFLEAAGETVYNLGNITRRIKPPIVYSDLKT